MPLVGLRQHLYIDILYFGLSVYGDSSLLPFNETVVFVYGLVSTFFRLCPPLTRLVLYGRRIGSDMRKNETRFSLGLPQRSTTIFIVCVPLYK